MVILAIETSCDETSASLIRSGKNAGNLKFRILSNIVSSQVKIHAQWGGVVPSLAKREHQKNLLPVLTRALKEAKLLKTRRNARAVEEKILKDVLEREPLLYKRLTSFLKKYDIPKIDAIAVTHGPGLEPALWMGVNFSRALSLAWNKPLIPINHMEGHLFSVFLKENGGVQIPKIKFPIVALLVSGGHTELVLVKNWFRYDILGQTRDDAAGEAFHKAAKMMELGYPGGPAIALKAMAADARKPDAEKRGQLTPSLPRPMINSKDYDFSFSGLKTALLYEIKKLKRMDDDIKTAYAAEFQKAVIDVLVKKTEKAAREYGARTILAGGGVAANDLLRKRLFQIGPVKNGGAELLIPDKKFTGDNGAMIALAAALRMEKKRAKKIKLEKLKAEGNLKIA